MLQPVMAIMASIQPESGQIAYTGSDFQYVIWFHSPDHVVQNPPRVDLIWMAWSRFGQMHLVQKQAGLQESSS